MYKYLHIYTDLSKSGNDPKYVIPARRSPRSIPIKVKQSDNESDKEEAQHNQRPQRQQNKPAWMKINA